MLLAVDIGNTQTAMGIFDGEELIHHFDVTTNAGYTRDEVHAILASQLDLVKRDMDDLTDVVISSVVPSLTGTWRQVAERVTGKAPVVVGPGVKSGLPLHYDNPAEIGADRVADAVAAIHLAGAPVVVVDLGTATNIEVVDKKGNFRGGIIAPGLRMSANALDTYAARLPQVDLVTPKKVIGTNTIDAIRSGLIFGEVDRVDGLVRRIFDELGYEAPVIATGGLSGYISDLSTTITQREPRLTLLGLRLIFELNR